MTQRVELGSLKSRAEHLLDLALRAAVNGRRRPAARYFHDADALRASAPCVQQAEHFLDRALNAAAQGHIAAAARLAANAAQHFQHAEVVQSDK
jgi:HEPN domain-containing protein